MTARSNYKRFRMRRHGPLSEEDLARWDRILKRSQAVTKRAREIQAKAREAGRELRWYKCLEQAEEEIPIEYITE